MTTRTLLLATLRRAAARSKRLERVPAMKLLAVGELALVARKHLQLLAPGERRRLLELVRSGRGMSPSERTELRRLVGKLDARAFAGSTADRLSPVPLPKRLTRARF